MGYNDLSNTADALGNFLATGDNAVNFLWVVIALFFIFWGFQKF